MTEKQRRSLISLALALLSSYAMCCTFTAVQTPDVSFPELLYLGNRIGALVAAVLCLLLFFWYRKLLESSRKIDIASLVLSGIFAIMLVIGRAFSVEHVTYGVYGSFDTMFSSWQRCVFTTLVFFGLWVVGYFVVRFLFERLDALQSDGSVLQQSNDRESSSGSFTKKAADFLRDHEPWGYLVLFVVCWLPYLIVFFPGTIYVDGAFQLRQFFGADPYSGHHPLATTLLLGALVQVGRALGSDSLGVFLYTILQTLLVAYACARIVGCVRRIAPRQQWIAVASIVFFALVPVWGAAVVSIKKDALFYAAFGLLIVVAFELMSRLRSGEQARGKDYLKLFLLALAVSLIRNEGMFVACAVLCCLAVYLLVLKRPRKQPVVLVCVALGVALSYGVGYKVVLMDVLDAESGSIAEALTIPIQQTARFWIEAPEDVSDSIAEGVERVLDPSGFDESVYNPRLSDNIKFGFFHKDYSMGDLLAFARAYGEMGIEHPVLFAEAFVDQTLGWWYPELYGDPDHAVSGMGLWQLSPASDAYGEVVDSSLVFQDSGVIRAFTSLIDCFAYLPGIGMLVYPAPYFWAIFLLVAYLLRGTEKSKVIMYLPFVLNFLICIVSPSSGLTRYAMPVMMVMPLLIAFAMEERKGVEDRSSLA